MTENKEIIRKKKKKETKKSLTSQLRYGTPSAVEVEREELIHHFACSTISTPASKDLNKTKTIPGTHKWMMSTK